MLDNEHLERVYKLFFGGGGAKIEEDISNDGVSVDLS